MICATTITASTSQAASPDQGLFARATFSTPPAGSFAALCAAASSNQVATSNTQQSPEANSPQASVGAKPATKKLSATASAPVLPLPVTAPPTQPTLQPLLMLNCPQAVPPSLLAQPKTLSPEPVISVSSNFTDSLLQNSNGSVRAGSLRLPTITPQQETAVLSSSAALPPTFPAPSASDKEGPLPPTVFVGTSVADQPEPPAVTAPMPPPGPPSSVTNEQAAPETGSSSAPTQSLGQPSIAASLFPQIDLNESTAMQSSNLANTVRSSTSLSPPPTQYDSSRTTTQTVKATDSQLASNLAAVLPRPTILPTQNQSDVPSTILSRKQNSDTRLAPQPPTPPTLPVIDKPAAEPGSDFQTALQTIASVFSSFDDGSENPQVPTSASSGTSSTSTSSMTVSPNTAAIPIGAPNITAVTNTPPNRGPDNRPVSTVAASRNTESQSSSSALSVVNGTDLSPQKNSETAGQIAIVPAAVQQAGPTIGAANTAVQIAVGASANSGLLHKSDAAVLPPTSDARPTVRPALEPPTPLPPGPVQMAQLFDRAGQSEMRIGLNTSAFGSVEVHTVVHANEVGVSIGSEKGDLRSLLSNDLPGIANALQQQNLRLNHVNFQQGSTLSNSSGGNSQQQRSFARNTASFVPPHTDTQSRGGSDFIEGAAEGLNTGLSVLA
jgi:Flagellar hook-length control protein FliK